MPKIHSKSILVLLLAAAFAVAVDAGGIDFDLNEPPPPEYLDLEEIQFQLEADKPLSCPGPALLKKSRQQDKKSADSMRERFEHVMRMRAEQTAAKELPDYCDYEKFKAANADMVQLEQARQTNPDSSERIFRRSLYLKRCLDVFRARVEYRLGKKSYLEGVTPLADMSPNEVGQLFMSAPPMEFQLPNQSEQQYKAELREQRLALKENDLDLSANLDNVNDDDDDDDDDSAELRRMAEKLESGDSFAKDSQLVMDSAAVKSMIAAMLEKSRSTRLHDVDAEEYKLAIREELMGAELEHKSEACADFDEAGHALAPYPTERWPLSDKRPVGRVSGALPDELAGTKYAAAELKQWKRQYLDWSHHECFARVYKQFNECGCCYVVAALSLAEFASCTQQENLIARKRFSVMHVLNCGLKYHPYNMGCSGGSVLETLRFIGLAGTYRQNSWRDRVTQSARKKEFTDLRDINCPMTPDRPWHEWGQEKVLLNPAVVHPNEWLEALEDGPLVATVQMPRDGIVTYSGGVHDGLSCNGSGIWHVMVLVGFGVDEHGTNYWRFRNSFGRDWGDHGHFNLAMSVPGECFAGGVRVYREPVEL